MTTEHPFDGIRHLLATLPAGDEAAEARVRQLFARAEQPAGSLGRLAGIAAWLARWSGRPPAVNRPSMAVFAGNHGIVRHGVSPRPMEATQQAVELCAAGGAAINQLCLANDVGLKVFDLALDHPTADFTVEPALSERAAAATIAFGMEAASGTDLLCIGDLGVGNSTAAAAILRLLHGGSAEDWIGAGSGADAAMMARKALVVEQAAALHGEAAGDPLEILRRVGGREFAAIAGAIVAARTERIPVLLDGFAAAATASALKAMSPGALDHCLFAGAATEAGHARALAMIGARPLLALGLSHGEGAGAALAVGLVRSAAMLAQGLAAVSRR